MRMIAPHLWFDKEALEAADPSAKRRSARFHHARRQ